METQHLPTLKTVKKCSKSWEENRKRKVEGKGECKQQKDIKRRMSKGRKRKRSESERHSGEQESEEK